MYISHGKHWYFILKAPLCLKSLKVLGKRKVFLKVFFKERWKQSNNRSSFLTSTNPCIWMAPVGSLRMPHIFSCFLCCSCVGLELFCLNSPLVVGDVSLCILDMNSGKQRPKLWQLFHLRFLVSFVLMNRCIFLSLSSHFCVSGSYYNRVKRLSKSRSYNW